MQTEINPVALITGASKGIGKAVAMGLAEDGFNLVLCSRTEKDLLAAKEEILAKCPTIQVEVHSLDVRDSAAINNMVVHTRDTFNRIDLLFNNAGIYYGGTSDLSMKDFTDMLDINLRAPFEIISLVLPLMKAQKSGHIMNLSSRSGKTARAAAGGYAASKYGLVGLNEALYKEVSELGIRVTALCPGFVSTEMGNLSGLDASEMISTLDVVKTVRWLLSLSPAVCVKDIYFESVRQVNS
ncbi:MAG: SDR family oxidoreductase [Candidatus Obscuribacter sp.]|nr:SDR family oxidoreductase [Candidatus Obscuribacter sp.]